MTPAERIEKADDYILTEAETLYCDGGVYSSTGYTYGAVTEAIRIASGIDEYEKFTRTIHTNCHNLKLSPQAVSFLNEYASKQGPFRFIPFIFKEEADHSYEVFHLNGVPQDYRDQIMRLRDNSDPPISEKFLISKGWVKESDDTRHYLSVNKFELDFVEDHTDIPEVVICNEYGFFDGIVYRGPLPTESQYEVLNQLLKLHP